MAEVLRLTEVAEYLRVHPSTIYRLLRRKELPAFKVGSDWLPCSTDIDCMFTSVHISVPDTIGYCISS